MRTLALACLLPVVAVQTGHAQFLSNWQARGEVGLEYDSNPSRLERVAGEQPPSIEGASVTRLNGNGSISQAVTDTVSMIVAAGGALRVFLPEEARRESMGILNGMGAVNLRVARATALQLSLGYYEAFQSVGPTARDFRSVFPGAQFDMRLGPGIASLGAGYRWFVFKPLSAFDFIGPRVTANYRVLSLADLETDPDGADWDLVLHTFIEHRRFSGARCLENEVCPPTTPADRRVDDFAFAGIEVTRTGDHLLGAGLGGQWNVSNSFGDGLFRISVHAKGAFALPWKLLLSVRGELLLSRYSVPLPLARDEVTGLVRASIEEESRSTVRCELSRALGSGVELLARYVLYSNELGRGPVQYFRQTILLALSLSFEPD